MPKPVTITRGVATPPAPKIKHRPYLWEVIAERQLLAAPTMGAPPVFIKEEEKAKFEEMGFHVYWEPSKVNFRQPYECDLPYEEFMDEGRLFRRVNGVWEAELRSSGMPERGPDYVARFWKLNSSLTTMHLDLRAEVLAGRAIPSAVVEHPFLTFYDSYWPRERIYPSYVVKSVHHYMQREGGQYVKSGFEYVFKPNRIALVVRKPLSFKKAVTPEPALTKALNTLLPAPVRKRGDEEEPDLFNPAPRLRE